MHLTHSAELDRFVLFASYHEKDEAKRVGFRWHPETKTWQTADPVIAKRMIRHANDAAKARLEALQGLNREALASSSAETSDAILRCPEGLEYLPYQRAGIAYALERKRVLIADEPGLGKTIQAIGVVNETPLSASPFILVICPATLRLNWEAEWRKWCVEDIQPSIVTDRWPKQLRVRDLFSRGVVAILSYEGAVKWKKEIDATAWDVLILDEAHLLKNPTTQRTCAVFGKVSKNKIVLSPIHANRILALTGTPIVNRPAELWPLVHALDPSGVGLSRKRFYDRYVYENHLTELHDLMRSRFMVRRRKADVLKELPAKRRQVILIGDDHARAAVAAEQRLLASKRAELAELEHENAVQKLRQWRGAAMTEISRIRHETAMLKIPDAISHIRAMLDELEKLVVFVWHHDVSDALFAAFHHAVVLDGRKTPEEKDTAVRRFQSDPAVKLFIGSIAAAGMGITLTAASTVVFIELSWTPAEMIQSEDRVHRIGQRESVLVQHLVIDGSIDATMSRTLISKAETIAQVLDGEIPESLKGSVLDDVLKR